jgi:hypothetical protein
MSERAPSPTANDNNTVPNREKTPAPPARVPKTHISDAVSTLLKALPLTLRLKCNKEIESLNEARQLKTLLHVQDPINNPLPGSETASLITIDSSEVKFLSSPNIFDTFRDSMPFYLIRKLSDIKAAAADEKLPKRRDINEGLTDSTEDTVVARAAWHIRKTCISLSQLSNSFLCFHCLT